MLHPSLKPQSAEHAVQAVIEILVDSQEGLVTVGEKLQDQTLKRYFLAESLKRAQFIGQLETALREQGVRRFRDRGSPSATLHRTWARLKSKLIGGDYTLLVTAEQGEEAVGEICSKAMQADLPATLRRILKTQAKHIEYSHAYVKAARDLGPALHKAAPNMGTADSNHHFAAGPGSGQGAPFETQGAKTDRSPSTDWGQRMLSSSRSVEVDPATLIEIIRIQTEIAKLGLDLAGVINAVVNCLPPLTNAHGAVVEYVDGEQMVCRGASGIASALLGYRVQREASLSGLSATRGKTLKSNDVETDPRVDPQPCRRAGIRSIAVAPLSHEGISVGTLKIVSSETGAFSDRDMFVVELMSDLIAAAMYHSAKNQSDELYVQATHDVLTGLANRTLFYDRLRQRISNGRRRSQTIGVLNIDMDGLKQINDRWGHRAGDAAIRETAKRISRVPRNTDLVARLGGDEFAVMLDSVRDRASVMGVASKILREVRRPFETDGHELALSASVGTASFPEDGTDIDTLLEKADQAMYAMKSSEAHRAPRPNG
ncbi:GAF sensor-containing diguanylate cyclase (modular protein) [Candidatus Sulfotelmatomonas gaucii]|uniref:GAF sensor-containing diguanylate cyclase (Modular protein) n=1 Tax=Candidatus Sulfuritelmatomonas gaucii TaxID=2043161 RepID=A0A2N9L549_9BACT|nr:GAF sensor-containing diguanylate cyclase (modular protein) [Candidatus Sulfotelmatomonas gaucii]